MTIAIGQFTITDFNDINISNTEPISPVLDMLWLDTSATPYTLKSWNGAAWVASRALSLAELDAIQDAKLNTRITTFYQPTVPTSTAVGDFWVDTSNNNHLYRAECIGADEIADGEWVSARDNSAVEELEEFVDTIYTPGIANLQEQIDGKIDTWYQPHEPGPWTGKERIDHHGDMWYQTGTGILRRYNGSWNVWEIVESQTAADAYARAAKADDTADNKRRVFTAQPYPPYDVGDLWTDGPEGELYRCIKAKAHTPDVYLQEGLIILGAAAEFEEDDWELATKYTDDSALTNFVANTYTPDQSSLQTQIDGKIETYFQETDPNTWTEADRAKHNGDMWYSSSTKLLKRYDGTTNSWNTIEDQKAIDAYTAASQAQDTADGKRRVFTTTPTPPYDVGDLWSEGSEGDLKRCKTAKDSEGVYSASDWELATKYTDDSAANSKNTAFSACPSDGKYKKNDIMIPSEGFVSGAKTFNAGEIYQALADGDGLAFNPVHWAEASLISLWKKTGTTTIDGGQIATDTVTADKLVANTAMINFLNALNLTAKYVSAEGILAGIITLTEALKIASSDGNLEITGTELKYAHTNGTESHLDAAGLRLYDNGEYVPYVSTVLADFVSRTAQGWNYTARQGGGKCLYSIALNGNRWIGKASSVKVIVSPTQHIYPLGGPTNASYVVNYFCEVDSVTDTSTGVLIKILSMDEGYAVSGGSGYWYSWSLSFNYMIVLT